jgi:hypothetical protein
MMPYREIVNQTFILAQNNLCFFLSASEKKIRLRNARGLRFEKSTSNRVAERDFLDERRAVGNTK